MSGGEPFFLPACAQLGEGALGWIMGGTDSCHGFSRTSVSSQMSLIERFLVSSFM